MKLSAIIPTEKKMLMLGSKLACHCLSGSIIYLHGELGAGKTTLVRGFLRELGYQGTVKSPTYTLIESYEFKDGLHIYHLDLYRLEKPSTLKDIGLSDYLNSDSICLIEWPEKAGKLLPVATLHCYIEVISTGRKINLISEGEIGNSVLNQLTV